VKRHRYLASGALPLFVLAGGIGHAQGQTTAPAAGAPAVVADSAVPPPDSPDVNFSADNLAYDSNDDIVTATGNVHMRRGGDRLRADKITWNRKTGLVVASGNIVVTNPGGDATYGNDIQLTDTLKDGVIDNMLVVLDRGGRLAASSGTRTDDIITLNDAAYTPCSVIDSNNCPKQPSWDISAVRVVYDPARGRIFYKGARLNLFGLPTIPLPAFSNPVGSDAQSGFLTPDIKYGRTNGFEFALPYYLRLSDNRGLIITPRLFTGVLPMLGLKYSALTSSGAYQVTGYATSSGRTDAVSGVTSGVDVFRGYLDMAGKFQLGTNWSISGSIRLTTDTTFLRRYDISYDDLLRNTLKIERIDTNSYLSIAGWAVQTLRVGDSQGLQPIALPEIDYRRRFNGGISGSVLQLEINTLAIDRSAGQDTQRAFTSAEWDLRRITAWGQEVTITAYARGDIYNAHDTLATTVASYSGNEGISTRGIAALALDVKWPFVGAFLNGTQRLTPRIQFVAAPPISNLAVPNEDARAVDLDDTNLFALNRFPGYDRFEGASRFTYGAEWAANLPNLSIDATVGQSYQFTSQPGLVPTGTGFSDRLSDIVGRTEIRYKDFFSLTHRYRLDKDGLAVRRNEIDATIGSRSTYLLLGYLRLNRNITATLEDLGDHEEVRAAGRLQFARFWSMFGSTIIDLTNRDENPLSTSNGFAPIRHRVGFAYEDDCLKLGVTWKRDYQDTGDAKRGDSFLLTISFKNLGR
jgi:LPS-assembly protein